MGKFRHWLRSRSATPIQQRESESEPANLDLATSAGQSGSLEQPSMFLFPDGVEVLVNPPGADVDICFVYVSKSVASSNRLIDHAINLLTDLTNDRRYRNASGRPLIFVVYSLGGLICKEAILLSRNNPNRSCQDFFIHIKGVVFIGMPHKGLWIADWSGIPARALGVVKSTNRSLLEVLETNNQYLESIYVRFLSMMREQCEAGRQLEVVCFFEELPLSTVGKVVLKELATFEGYDLITIHANHADMVKFGSTEETGFKRVVGELTAWKSDLGRGGVITKLQKLLFAYPGGQQAALVGLGGVGKTQIALQLAHLAKNNNQSHQQYSIIWMPALSMASFKQAYTRIIKVFNIKHADNKDPKEIFKNFLNSKGAGRWFLIIDNADDMKTLYRTAQKPGGIADYIPDCEQGYILFTTRSRNVAVTVAQTNILELPEMDKKDARTLLQKSVMQKDEIQDTDLADRLLRELAYLPLAIRQASAYIAINRISIKEYIQLLQKTAQDMVELLSIGYRDGTHYNIAQGAVITTWIVSFKQIRALHEEAAILLSFASCLEPKAIPRTLLPRLGTEQSITRAIGTIYGKAKHAVVILGHVVAVEETTLVENHPDRLASQHALAGVYEANGQIAEAVKLLEHVVAVEETTLAENHPDRLASQHELAGVYKANGRIAEAVKLLEYVVTVEETMWEENHPH
ncbi:uncharacterized protein FFUJ_05326 [Fusarium fujikuroi IMI 58289]|uniref:NB-ARC domain-containing protein n=1 Tax=Gibberella fujikuroi (strain CBS 195.34 / IMI 58289 / NRRL A-6831) TaxID=1279085 RepID=S0DLQ9_GIBF5|nr:uncharacterized protein FFUJ_05326 [Fusarium fujikuroi IMI 58289]CCT63534.1 uncharacterized protein FFUJ_05326 [Fusarium fujikuroi IMI 58289]SCN97964.1 uncharacterized protein FFM5_06669 [Fusarium fujikuroi]